MTLVSVVIPTKSRPVAVLDAVRSVFACSYERFELFVIDQSTDGATRDALAAFAGDPRFHYYHNQRRAGASSSRNIGIALSSGDIVAIIDDDVSVCPDWMTNIVAEFDADADLQFLCGKLTAPPYDWRIGYCPAFDPEEARPRLAGWTMCMAVAGANFSMRRALFKRVGGYDELWGPGSSFGISEDGDIAFRILRSGAKWKACSSVEVVHTHGFRPAADAATLLKQYQYGIGANFGRFTRRGDILAGLWFVHLELLKVVRVVLPNILRRRRPTRFGWVRDRLVGFWRGFLLPPDEGFVSGADLERLHSELISASDVARPDVLLEGKMPAGHIPEGQEAAPLQAVKKDAGAVR